MSVSKPNKPISAPKVGCVNDTRQKYLFILNKTNFY